MSLTATCGVVLTGASVVDVIEWIGPDKVVECGGHVRIAESFRERPTPCRGHRPVRSLSVLDGRQDGKSRAEKRSRIAVTASASACRAAGATLGSEAYPW